MRPYLVISALAFAAGCAATPPPEFRVTGDFSGSINDDCTCGVDHQFGFDVSCGGSNSPTLFIDAPTAGEQVIADVTVFFSAEHVGSSTLAGTASVVAVYPGGEKMFDGYTSVYRPFQVISADAPMQHACDPLNGSVCADIPAFKIRNATFNCEENVF